MTIRRFLFIYLGLVLIALITGYWLLCLILLALPILPLLVHQWRRHYIIKPLFHQLQQSMPKISTTEREALEAGTVGWDGQLFTGKPDWQQLLSNNQHALSAEERAFIDGPVNELCAQLDDWQISQYQHDLPPAIWAQLKQQGFFGLIIPEYYGGLDFSPLAHSHIVMKIASRSITAAVTVMVPNSLGPAELLLHYGTQQQKDQYLPRLANGDEIPCFALTGPEAGSDASNLPDTGIVCQHEVDGEKIIGILLNWEKRYITLGPVATLLGLAFHLYDPDHLIGDQHDIGITLALIPTDTPGITIGRRHSPMGMAFQNGPNWGKDVFIPLDYIIGGVEQAGKGWRMLMESLAAGRSISLPALSTGAAKMACQTTSAYARIREQFHQPISHFEGIADIIGRMAGLCYMSDATRTVTAQAVCSGEKPAVLSAIAKYQLTETMRQLVNDAMDIHGGKAISLGPNNLLARIYQAIPISITVEGANILTRNLIIFGQGSVRAHPYLNQEIACFDLADNEQAVTEFDRLVTAHSKYTLSNFGRCFIYAITKGYFSKAPESILKRYYQQLNHLSAALAVTTDFSLMTLGGSLKRKESLSARLGDVLSQLYLASCTLRYFEHNQADDDAIFAQWAVSNAIFNAQTALLSFTDNLPNRVLGRLLRLIIFPLGQRYKKPDDKLTHALSAKVTEPSDERNRLIDGIFQPSDANEPLYKLERAFKLCSAAAPIEKRLKQAHSQLSEEAVQNGLITGQEYQLVKQAREARRQVIEVDHFTAELTEDGL